MTQEEQNLLIRDLCGRLPYGVKIKEEYGDYINVNIHNANIEHLIDRVVSGLDKLVLRPLSSMTEEEYQEFNNIRTEHTLKCLELSDKESFELGMCFQQEELLYLYQRHYDICGLIPKGIVLEAPEGMYENESDSVIDNTTKITVGCKIRSKINPDVILRIVSDDCHGDKFECSNGSVLSLKQINKYYDLYIEENKGTIIIN